MPQLFIRSTIGSITINIDLNDDLTWFDIQEKIFEEKSIPIQSQTLLYNYRAIINLNERIDYKPLLHGNHTLALQVDPEFMELNPVLTLKNEQLCVVVHDYYRNNEPYKYILPTKGTYAIPITIEDIKNPDELNRIFARMYEIRKDHITKQKEKIAYSEYIDTSIALVAIKHSYIDEIDNYNKFIQFKYNEQNKLITKLISSMQENYTLIPAPPYQYNDETVKEQIKRIYETFHSFCTEKRATDPEQIQKDSKKLEAYRRKKRVMQKEVKKIRNNYGEVTEFIEQALEIVCKDKSPENILDLINKIELFCLVGIEPSIKYPWYEDVRYFNIVALADTFRIVKFTIAQQSQDNETETVLNQCRENIKFLLIDEFDKCKIHYSSKVNTQEKIINIIGTKKNEDINKWETLDKDVQCNISILTRPQRTNEYGGMSTSEYWDSRTEAQRQIICKEYEQRYSTKIYDNAEVALSNIEIPSTSTTPPTWEALGEKFHLYFKSIPACRQRPIEFACKPLSHYWNFIMTDKQKNEVLTNFYKQDRQKTEEKAVALRLSSSGIFSTSATNVTHSKETPPQQQATAQLKSKKWNELGKDFHDFFMTTTECRRRPIQHATKPLEVYWNNIMDEKTKKKLLTDHKEKQSQEKSAMPLNTNKL